MYAHSKARLSPGVRLLLTLATALPAGLAQGGRCEPSPWSASRGLLLQGTVVTMDAARNVIEDGRVLVRDGRIVAVWRRNAVPPGVIIGSASVVDAGNDALIFPGLVNLHGHPSYDVLPLWAPPASHAQPGRGRPLGTEPYANRYDWNIDESTSPAEYLRLVVNAAGILSSSTGLGLFPEVVKYAEVKALLAGTTAIQGAPASTATDTILARNVDNMNFDRDRIENMVPSIGLLTGSTLQDLLNRMRNGQVDAWLAHIAEGVRDGDRRPGDTTSSRCEFVQLQQKGLLADTTVILHGIALEAADFLAMAQAPTLRTDGYTDRLGAKLVWSPLSNLLLYGKTTNVYEAMAAGVTISLGTDWSPSGSANLLAELKIADIALRDARLLAGSRHLVPGLQVQHVTGHERRAAERLLDQKLVEMVTINPARTLRWDAEVGSITAGKTADLLVIRDPRISHGDVPSSPYRSLIDATERDVELVLVDGEPLAGNADLMSALKPGDVEVVPSISARRVLAVDTTRDGVPRGTQTLAVITGLLDAGLAALGGDHPPAGGGQSEATNTYSYLKARFQGTAFLTDEQFRAFVLLPFFGTANGRLNLEGMRRAPLIMGDDDWRFAVLGAALDAHDLPADRTPPYARYRSNLNQVGARGNPFAPRAFEERWY